MTRTILAAIALLAPLAAWGQTTAAPAGSLWIEGDSTLHKWTSTTTIVEMTFALADGAGALPEAIAGSQVKTAELKVAVADLKSGDKGLDKNMRKAMKADEFPSVTYRLLSYELSKPVDGVLTAKTTGELTIAGKTRTISMDLRLDPKPGEVLVRGSHPMAMSDYGIAPPRLMMGAIKVRDEVAVRFALTFKSPHKEN